MSYNKPKEPEDRSHLDVLPELMRKLRAKKGLSKDAAFQLILRMADQDKLVEWLAKELENLTREELARLERKCGLLP